MTIFTGIQRSNSFFMKKKLLLLLAITYVSAIGFGQTVVWSEDFGTPASGTSANGFNNGNGPWTVTNTGANGSEANEWVVSGMECGNAPGACGTSCPNGDASLHISPNVAIFGDAGAAYAAGGGGFIFIETDKRVESPFIDLTGQTNLTLNFNYLEDYVGQAGYDPGDDATLWYFDGATWALLDPLAVTPATCAPQGTWTAFSIALPASANNNPNVKIGFHWFNNDDNVGTDPSFAVDDIEITTPSAAAPVADFSASSVSICEGDCIDFTDLSTLSTNPTWTWTFNGAATGTSSAQNPTGICYLTAGTYDVELTVTDDNGNDTETKVGYITVQAAPQAGTDGSGNVCNNGTIDLATLLSGADAGGTWSETTGTPSGQLTGSVLDGNGLPVGNVYTFDYTVAATAPCTGNDVSTFTITVIDCSTGPTAEFNMSTGTTICAGDDITFTDISAGSNVTNWNWTFNGGTPGSAATQGPHTINFPTAGNYDIILSVDDDNGTDDTTVTITVQDCGGGLTASFTPSAMTICQGECITFTDNSTGAGITSYGWTFQNGTPGTFGPSATFDPGSVCFNTAGTADITLLISDGSVVDDTTITITVNPRPVVDAGTDQTVCAGDAVTLSGSGASTYVWDNGVVDGVSFVPSATTTYTVTGTDANGCDNSDQVTITVNSCVPLIAGFSYIDNLCVGDCITISDTSQGVPNSWAWDFGGAATPNTDTVQNPVVCFNTAGTYDIQLTVTDAGGASSSTTNTITIFDSPTVEATTVDYVPNQDTLIDLAGEANLIAVGSSPGTYLWEPDTYYIECDTCPYTYASPYEDTYYTVTLTDVNGCYGQDSVLVLVNFIEGIGVPQAFSPNGDGQNDILFVKGEGIQSLNFKIYNRYGQKVFETTDQNIGWDGKFHGREENPGVFVWVLEYTFITGQGGIQKGNTTLVR